MTVWMQEVRLLLRMRTAPIALALLAALTIAALVAGAVEISRQRAAIGAIPAAQAEDIAAVGNDVARSRDPGGAAYYGFFPTWNAPGPLAFAALGMRDVAPYILRVRALGLEAQIYDGDVFNPELALPGRFDFAFVLVFLAPLFVIALLHDLVSGEREAGRLHTLDALPRGGRRLFRRRTILRVALCWAALALPFWGFAIPGGVDVTRILIVTIVIAAYLLFWVVLAVLVSRLRWSSVANAATLAAIWLVLVLVVPTLAHLAINAALPISQGTEIALAQRERVNAAWDIPREDTMQLFYAHHPAWSGSAPLGTAFHYKWYLAFHQNGDESVAARARAYRAGLERRDAASRTLGWIVPSVGVQALLTRLAGTDLAAHLAYQDRIRGYHRRLREFFYGYLFNDRPFDKADLAKVPRFRDRAPDR
jgi:ABC-2 type transport system permease protein